MIKFKVQWKKQEVLVLEYNLNNEKFLIAIPSQGPDQPAHLKVVHIDELELTTAQMIQLSMGGRGVH